MLGELRSTGTDMNTLVDIGTKFATPPENFNLHAGRLMYESRQPNKQLLFQSLQHA